MQIVRVALPDGAGARVKGINTSEGGIWLRHRSFRARSASAYSSSTTSSRWNVWGFVEAFSISRFRGTGYFSPPPYPFEIVLISNELKPKAAGARPAPVKSANGPRVAPDVFRDEALSQPFDLLMIPGGGACAPCWRTLRPIPWTRSSRGAGDGQARGADDSVCTVPPSWHGRAYSTASRRGPTTWALRG